MNTYPRILCRTGAASLGSTRAVQFFQVKSVSKTLYARREVWQLNIRICLFKQYKVAENEEFRSVMKPLPSKAQVNSAALFAFKSIIGKNYCTG